MNVLIPNLPQQLSFSKSLSITTPQLRFLPTTDPTRRPPPTAIIRMGGGPRTYPGGVSKWQWKRMQANKAKQLLKARLCRERQIYEMRKRAELRAAVSELERPWEPVERAPNLFSVRADEQVKVLADRFQKPGGFDLWSEKDGPQLFETPDELPSARFFPKGVVHSVRPYRRIGADELLKDGDSDGGCSTSDSRFLSEGVDDGSDDGEFSSATLSTEGNNGVSVDGGLTKNWRDKRSFLSEDVDDGGFSSSPMDYGKNGVNSDGRMRKNGNRRKVLPKGVGEGSDNGAYSSSPSSYGRNGGNYDGRMRRNGNGRRPLSKGVDYGTDGSDNGAYSSSSPSSYGRNGENYDGGIRRNGKGRRPLSKSVDYGSDSGVYSSSPSSYGRNRGNYGGGMRRNENGRRPLSKGVEYKSDGSDHGAYSSSPSSYGRHGGNYDGGMRRNGNGRRPLSKDADYGSDDGECSSPPLSSEMNGGGVDGRMRKNGNGRRFMLKDVNGLYSGRVGSGRKQGVSNSVAGGKYSRGASRYASPRVRDADSEVYDMDLQQDGSYGVHQDS